MVRPEAFLAIEASLSLRLSDTFTALMGESLQAMETMADEGNYDGALSLVRGMDLDPVFDLNLPYIRYLSQIAMLFGASQAGADAATSSVGLGFEKTTVATVVASLRESLTVGGLDYLTEQAVQLIARKQNPEPERERTSDSSYLGSVLKAAKASAVLPFASFMDQKGRSFFNMASSLHTSRLSAFGFTAEAKYLGITHYVINEQLDGRTCPVCRLMHKKVFAVRDARALLDVVTRTQDPVELTNLQPWPSQSSTNLALIKAMSPEDLVAAGWHVPPFHPRCRGLLARAGRVPDLSEVPQQQPEPVPETYEATAEDFLQFGVKLNPTKVKQWNDQMNTAPAEVLAKLSGLTTSAMLEKTLTASDPAKAVGLTSFKVTPSGINIELTAPVHGSKKPVVQDLYFRTDQNLFIGSTDIQQGDQKVYKKVMNGLYGTAKATGMQSMSKVTKGYLAGYAMPRYGFAAGALESWANLKVQVQANATAEVMAKATKAERKALAAILESNDPKDVFALADLPNIGKPLLAGTSWEATLDFLDPESMARFYNAMK